MSKHRMNESPRIVPIVGHVHLEGLWSELEVCLGPPEPGPIYLTEIAEHATASGSINDR